MTIQTQSREALVDKTLAGMLASEPRAVANASPFDTDVLAQSADHTVGLWRITWFTSADDPRFHKQP